MEPPSRARTESATHGPAPARTLRGAEWIRAAFRVGWPLGIALASVLAGCSLHRTRSRAADVAESMGTQTRVPLHPVTHAPALAAHWLVPGNRILQGDPESQPVWFALRSDRTLIWSENARSSGGRPYRLGKLDEDAFRELLQRLREPLDALPKREERISGVPCGADEFLCVCVGENTYEYSWWPGSTPQQHPDLGVVLDSCAALQAFLPARSEALDLPRLAFGPAE